MIVVVHMPNIIKWIHDWCRGNDRLNKVEEFLCTIIDDEVIKSNRLVQVGIDAVAQLIHLRIHCGPMITRRFEHLNFEVNQKLFLSCVFHTQNRLIEYLIKQIKTIEF